MRWAPSRADGVARHSPYLLGVRLEKSAIELAAEAVDEKLLQVPLFADRQGLRPGVAAGDPQHAKPPQVRQRVPIHPDGIVEEPAAMENATFARPQEHHPIGDLWVRPVVRRPQQRRQVVSRGGCMCCRRPLQRQHLKPPGRNPVGFGEEAVAANVRPVALVVDCLGEPSQGVAHLQHNGLDARADEQLVGRRQSRRSGPDDHGCLVAHRCSHPDPNPPLNQNYTAVGSFTWSFAIGERPEQPGRRAPTANSLVRAPP